MTVDARDATARLIDLNEGHVGASTGYMEPLRGRWEEMVREAALVSRAAVELSALSGGELPALAHFLDAAGRPDFGYVSIHGPAKQWVGTPATCAAELADVADVVAGIVMHPETLVDLEPFAALTSKLLLENMDPRKPDARTVAELRPYFEALPESGFCLDVAHALLMDPTMREAHALLDAFGDRLREVHVSSILSDGTHVPLTVEDVDRFWRVLERCRGVPWILEAPPLP